MKRLFHNTLTLLLALSAITAAAQPADTLVVKVGKESKVIFAIKDKQDLDNMFFHKGVFKHEEIYLFFASRISIRF